MVCVRGRVCVFTQPDQIQDAQGGFPVHAGNDGTLVFFGEVERRKLFVVEGAGDGEAITEGGASKLINWCEVRDPLPAPFGTRR